MKHAYLILAHNEFQILQLLVTLIDNKRNDIFIHLDKKIKSKPLLDVRQSELYFVEDAVDVRWGDISVVEAEYKLFELASASGDYSYFHLISGVDLPLKTQKEIHEFFNQHQGKEFIGFNNDTNLKESLKRKVNKYHLFPKHFRDTNGIRGLCRRVIRAGYLKIQYIFNIQRNQGVDFKKGSQWVSVSRDMVQVFLKEKNSVFSMYKNTFCPDEIYKQTICWNSDLRDNVFDYQNEARGSQREISWFKGEIRNWEDIDYNHLCNSEYLFSRKFTIESSELVYKIFNKLFIDINDKSTR